MVPLPLPESWTSAAPNALHLFSDLLVGDFRTRFHSFTYFLPVIGSIFTGSGQTPTAFTPGCLHTDIQPETMCLQWVHPPALCSSLLLALPLGLVPPLSFSSSLCSPSLEESDLRPVQPPSVKSPTSSPPAHPVVSTNPALLLTWNGSLKTFFYLLPPPTYVLLYWQMTLLKMEFWSCLSFVPKCSSFTFNIIPHSGTMWLQSSSPPASHQSNSLPTVQTHHFCLSPSTLPWLSQRTARSSLDLFRDTWLSLQSVQTLLITWAHGARNDTGHCWGGTR